MIDEKYKGKDSGVNEEEAKMRKVSTTPFIKTVMADAEVVDATGFSMYNWIELQAILKSNYFVVKNGKFILRLVSVIVI